MIGFIVAGFGTHAADPGTPPAIGARLDAIAAPADAGAARPRAEHRTVLLLPGEHVRLTRNAVFADNLIYWLLGAPRG